MRRNQYIGTGIIIAIIILTGVGLWKTSGRRGQKLLAVVRHCTAVMGTDCSIAATVEPGRRASAEQFLRRAETALRNAEALLSTWLDDSELGRFNTVAADRHVPLSAESLHVLHSAHDAFMQTDGAFDVTCRPIIELWRTAPKRGAVPTRTELDRARAESNWDLIRLTDSGAVKLADTVRIDLGGIAKGYAIEQAADVLRRAELAGGLVEVGGDIVCFGRPPSGESWEVDIKDPFGAGRLARLRLPDGGAVCTSGNYARFSQLAGRRHSHIIDPRTGQPADAVLSVTVVAADAVTADIWATALSVLGPAGFDLLPHGVEAMMVTDTKDNPKIHCTPTLGGMASLASPWNRQHAHASRGHATLK